jgi:lipopolysaccharide/colanic/teichoic acid biosynthesis glycosyltransferase
VLPAPAELIGAPAELIGEARGRHTRSATWIAEVRELVVSGLERCFDLCLLVLLAPVITVIATAIAIAIYLDSPGAVIFRQRRVGRDGKPFEMLKFRKMRAESPYYPVTLKNDERFTPIGRFLANTRLDELPQVINVLKGEMRLVGPRPELDCFVSEFAEEYEAILAVTPGITGRAQLLFLDEKSLLHQDDPASVYTDHVLPEKVKIDVSYARSRSFGGDLAILGRTLALPFWLPVGHLRSRRRHFVRWIPATLLAVALVLAFTLSAGNIG